MASPQPPTRPFNIPQPRGGVDRNAVALYELPNQKVVEHFIHAMPVRVSALRALGAYGNVFAIESFIDELALLAGVDPVEFRLRHLKDDRACAVIQAAAKSTAWSEPLPKGGRRKAGRGLGFGRYKNLSAYVAVAARVTADPEKGSLRVERVDAAVDAGQIINPDGVRSQIEGGIVQSVSWTVKERVRFDRSRITSTDWNSYPILTLEEVPEVEVELLDRPEDPALGVGEVVQGPTAAAVANALDDATGVRVRHLPLAPFV